MTVAHSINLVHRQNFIIFFGDRLHQRLCESEFAGAVFDGEWH
ncbi:MULTISPECIES: hypothetical protein [Planktothricoides]|nr:MULTISPECIES: hypothetical protein [Planktothricoides]